LSGLDPAAFNALFDTPRISVFRWEAQPAYSVPDTDASLEAFRTGAPRPERSVRTSPWLRRIAVQAAAGVDWSRVRVIGEPLSEYDRWSLLGYVESQAAGEQIRIAAPSSDFPDFWLIDPETTDTRAVIMRYDDNGRLLAREPVADRTVLDELTAIRADALAASIPLNVWLARQGMHG
jgi:hypothetical protein